MIGMRLILFLIVSSLLLLNSCTKCSRDDSNKHLQVRDTTIQVESDKVIPNSEKKTQAREQTVKHQPRKSFEDTQIEMYFPGKILAPDTLKTFMPITIAGAIAAKPSTGIVYGETGNVSTVSLTYDFSKGGVVMRITDYGKKENIPSYDLKYFSILPSRSGFESETIIDEMGKGYLLWNTENNTGELYYFLANRFIIRIEGYTVPTGTGGLVFFFDKIKRKKLIEKIKYN